MQENAKFSTFYQLPHKRQLAVVMLAEQHSSQRSVAKKLAVTESTLSRWCQDPTFQTAQMEWDQELFRRLRSKAIDTIHNLLTARSEMVRFSAASYVLDHTLLNEEASADDHKTKLNDLVEELEAYDHGAD